MTALFDSPGPDIRRIPDGIPGLINKTFPLPERFRAALPADVAELSRLFTSGRGERKLSYLARPNLLSAYLRFFLPWNLYRLCRLLPSLDIPLSPGGAVVDLGAGPLTLAAALWISRPEFRVLPLEFCCIDRSAAVLEAGKKFFSALAEFCPPEGGGKCPWKIKTLRGSVGVKGVLLPGGRAADFKHGLCKGGPAALVCAVNVFNEMYGDVYRPEELRRYAEHSAGFLCGLSGVSGSVLVVEPGVPRSGEFISALRSALIEKGRVPLSPCPHAGACPFPGGKGAADGKGGAGGRRRGGAGKGRWCHFAFDTKDAPGELSRLSVAAGLPKERAVLSFLFAGQPADGAGRQSPSIRVISDAFPLNDGSYGRYGCSGQGLALVTGNRGAVEKTGSGALLSAIDCAISEAPARRDPRSGALLVKLFS
ncbi:MAG: rRNA methyltransferase [Treponema sp.]|nr:rRNA methyltransferase [Treponema sp.]